MDDTMVALNVRPRETENTEERGMTFVKKVRSPDTKARLDALQANQDNFTEDKENINQVKDLHYFVLFPLSLS